MAKVSKRQYSYLAMMLSLMIPGLGQLYQRRIFEGVMLFLGVVFAGLLIYGNSYPVTGWHDLTRLESNPDFIHLFTIDGTKIMFRPMWEFKVSGWIQGLLFWIYAVYNGWHGQQVPNRKAAKKPLKSTAKPRPVTQRKEACPNQKIVNSTRGLDRRISAPR